MPREENKSDSDMESDYDDYRSKRRNNQDNEKMRKSRDSERSVNLSMTKLKPQNKGVDKITRRNMKWTSFARSKVSFGFKHLAPAYVPSMSSDPRGLAICLDRLVGWSIPANVLREFRGRSNENFEITARLSLSMFHLNSSSFFGTTWMGPSVSLGNGDSFVSKAIDFPYPDVIYLTTRIIDPSCIGVVEMILSKQDAANDLILSQCGYVISFNI